MRLQQLAKILGYAGLVPFIVFSTGTWITLPMIADAHYLLLTYAAVILSFMAAIHWGLAMAQNSEIAKVQLGSSVVPALLGWLALLIHAPYGYFLLVICFLILYLADKNVNARGLLPGWYLPMRVVLTAVVVFCLVIAALAAL